MHRLGNAQFRVECDDTEAVEEVCNHMKEEEGVGTSNTADVSRQW